MINWTIHSLKDVTTKIGSGATPRGGKETYKSEGISFIRSQNVLDFTFSKQGLAYIDKYQAEKLHNVTVEEDDVLINITGDSVARVCGAPSGVLPARVNQHVAILRPSIKLDSRFLKYYLLSPRQKGRLLMLASSGATRNALTKDMLENFPIHLPLLQEQRVISNILGTLDDKIELNRQMNQTLEAMAQALFKSWFVDFDPVIDNALATGQPIPDALKSKAERRKLVSDEKKLLNKNPDLAAQFPDTFQYDETLGKWIPEGWEVKTVEDISDKVFSGGTPSTTNKDYWGGEFSWFSSGETRDHFITDTEKSITQAGIDNSSTKLSLCGDILIASAGQGNTRGQTSFNCINTYINQSVVGIRAVKYFQRWLYFNLKARYAEMRMISDSHSIRGSLTTRLIREMSVIIPNNKRLLEYFDQMMKPVIIKITNNKVVSKNLTQLRDTLLPQLISGKLRIPVHHNSI